jgi:hypothetical protein
LFANSSVSNLASHIKNGFFLSPDTRDYLTRIFSHAEKSKSIVVLKINSVATSPIHRSVLAFSGVEGLFSPPPSEADPPLPSPPPARPVPFCAVYPETKYCEDMMRESRSRKIRLPVAKDGFASDEAFVLVPLQNVQELPDEPDGDDDDDDGGDGEPGGRPKKVCLRRRWDEMNRQLESEIEASFEMAKWNVAKNPMREILKCPQVCISSDYRLAYVREQEFSIIDFLKVATRKSGPNEGSRRGARRDDLAARFVPLLVVLLANHAPTTYVVNKRLYNLAAKHLATAPPSLLRRRRSAAADRT